MAKRERCLRMPSVKEVARELRMINTTTGDFEDEFGERDGIDVRLQVHEGGGYSIHEGDSQYDTDHRGYWGASSVPGNNKRFNAIDLAKELIDQAADMAAQDDVKTCVRFKR